MAPRKKADETKTKPLPKPATRTSTRLTRSSAKRLNARLTELSTDSGKKRKQGKAEESKTKEKKVKTAAETATATATATSTEAQVEVNNEDEKEEKDEADEDGDGDEVKEEDVKGKITSTGDGANKTIVIEHCKQCNAFKTRAMQVKDGLLSAFPGISVLLNPEKVLLLNVINLYTQLLVGSTIELLVRLPEPLGSMTFSIPDVHPNLNLFH
ncbi:unnamed protein product [Dovyalis caffra]|uniref:Selenoprotein H n=1 Tax=Dovyalis caffra TaxID=77055 RepID=A0AAV1SPS4_9ROSI|nr:unnamed protein product [Dovyalis caffra]